MMLALMDYVALGTYANIVLAIIQALTLIALIIYVIKTSEIASATKESAKVSEGILQEMKETRDAEVAPYVVVHFQIDRTADALYLVIKNIGKSIATNVKLNFRPELKNTEKTEHHSVQTIANSPLIKYGIETMPPGYELKLVLDRAGRYIKESLSTEGYIPMVYYVEVSYGGDPRSDKATTNYVLDLNPYRGFLES